ncbi:MAG: EutN/CcmL family microcompartment protein [Cellulosilyticaceae bacterium]
MLIGKVKGNIVSTRKHESLVGSKLLIVERLENISEKKEMIVAVDTVGAGVGDVVLVTIGGSARYSLSNMESPVDAAIIGIIDDGNNL